MSRAEPIPAGPLVLTFHKLSDKFSFGATNYSPKRFERLLEILLDQDYKFISLEQAVTQGSSSKEIAVTFDDGYQHLLNPLPSLIKRYKITPTVFIPSELIGKSNRWDYSSLFRPENHLNESDIKTLADLGVQFGSHSASHADLTRLDNQLLSLELRQSRENLRALTGQEIDFISYPFGRHNNQVRTAAIEAGYKAAFTMDFPAARDDNFSLGRIPIYGYDTPFSILNKLIPGSIYRLEKTKAKITNKLSGGTAIYRKIRPGSN